MHVALIGAGNMGFAMLRGWTKLDGYTFSVAEPNEGLLQRARDAGAQALTETSAAIDVLVIATKPQMVVQAVDTYKHRLAPNALLVSVAAGVAIGTIAARLDAPAAIVRAMPNTPAAIGEGMIVCCPDAQARDERHRRVVQTLLSATGKVTFIADEAYMDAVTAVSGSGPAYVFHFIEALQAAAVAAGLDGDLALLLAKQTVCGIARHPASAGHEPERHDRGCPGSIDAAGGGHAGNAHRRCCGCAGSFHRVGAHATTVSKKTGWCKTTPLRGHSGVLALQMVDHHLTEP